MTPYRNFRPMRNFLNALRGPLFQVKVMAFLGFVSLVGYQTAPPNLFDISKNLDIFGRVLREIDLNYVDEVEVNRFVRVGVDAMLKSLDPYTNYYSASEVEDYRFLSTGQYGGIGTSTQFRDGRFTITEIVKGSPAEKNGLWVGDIILRIDNQLVQASDLPADVASSLLRGQPGTFIELEVLRPGEDKPRVLRLERADIKVDNVPYFGLLEGGIAYVALSGFTRDASTEVRRSIEEVRKMHPELKGIVLDLRGNLGGLLYEAIAVSNLFVNRGEVIVETKGRMDGSVEVYTAPNLVFDLGTPVAVLIDGNSASASEIVAGVLQDLDRGVIVGQRSYGKGLVQTTRPLSYNAQIKLTTAKYYTPSGRCIQELDYSRGGEGEVIVRADSLRRTFFTRNRRPVYDGQGIMPDVPVDGSAKLKITKDLVEKHLVFDFATEFRRRNPSIGNPITFQITDEIYNQFVVFATDRGFSYMSRPMQYLARTREAMEKEMADSEALAKLEALEAHLRAEAAREIQLQRAEIERVLKAAIVERYAYQTGVIESSFADDAVVLEAVRILSSPERYRTILNSRN